MLERALTVTKRFVTRQRRKLRRRAMLISGIRGDIQFADPAARRWLRQFFGRPPRTGVLPRKVYQWVSKPTRDGDSLVAKTANAQLYLKREPSYTDDNLVLLLELIKGKSEERRRRHRQLTRREREVLFWVARGKSNCETGTILGISPSTVGKHLERIYQKLGVENRTAASSFGFEH
jgi:DNA-binding CsgD family transcriptional regulator